jgi:hypothetical protein
MSKIEVEKKSRGFRPLSGCQNILIKPFFHFFPLSCDLL